MATMSNTELARVWELIDAVNDDDNQFGSATAAWETWQDRAEELAGILAHLLKQGSIARHPAGRKGA